MNDIRYWIFVLIILFAIGTAAFGQNMPAEEDYFTIVDVTSPEEFLLEVGGLTVLPNGTLGVATRRGDIFIVENPTSTNPYFRKFATGLHEVLGLAYKDGALYCSQRGELTRLEDTDNDGKADLIETVYSWPLSGHYHEYSYGPLIAPDGSFFVSANVAFGAGEWWRGESRVPWRGWLMHISEDGKMEPWATGMRSPAGLGMVDGELFYAENQGDWIGSGGIWHVEKGDFTGHPAGLRWTDKPNSPLSMTTEDLYKHIDPRINKNERGKYIKPENIQDEEDYKTMFELQKELPALKTPAVWLPHGILGISNSDIQKIPEGHFGPFEGQLLVGDQGQSKISRIALEKVKGTYQGAAFDFRSGFKSGVLRMAWANDGSLFIGETNRGWGSAGESNEGLQRLVWNGQIPFEMKTIWATPDGFEIAFTKPVDPETARDLASYSVSTFIYKYHPVYGSPMVDQGESEVLGVKVSEDGTTIRLKVENLKKNYIHYLVVDGVRSVVDGQPLLHNSAYYTLKKIPDGPELSMTEVSIYDSGSETEQMVRETKDQGSNQGAPTYESVKPLLTKYTCTACHNRDVRQVGPAFSEIAQRNYTEEEMVELIYNPDLSNWPDFATAMPPMTNVPEKEAIKIAEWIISLNEH
ncbi:hypothetical protein NC796_02145 [Aliifodinibius sp. S!AR15-10]|uniref:hypothetical protein n=1 Tax=Aliifodinibius sp. S!AR15-10 TaxID=2950437 RepID=UPI0028644B49|nr:hypothetical protein [Aliifodinibius sp. S!AR15-10]MDR8389921.1 hypothetical protein [Aliifodinibius sp. S!AR15-10]